MEIITYPSFTIEKAKTPEPIIIFLPMDEIPRGWGKNNKQITKRGDKSFLRKSQKSMSLDATLKGLLTFHKLEKLLAGPIKLHVMVCYPYRKSEKKAIVKEGRMIPKTTSPDCDGLITTIMDVMQGLFYENDAQVYCAHSEKWWGPSGFIRIEIVGNPEKINEYLESEV